jgi:hypothetical protein
MGLKSYCIEIPLNGITFIQNFMKFNQAIQKLLVGDTQTNTQTDRQTDRLTDR